MDDKLLLPTLVYGSKMPDIRFRLHQGQQVVFCLRNGNLHLTGEELHYGTYEAGRFLGMLCRTHCDPQRAGGSHPCPAFARSHMIGTENAGLASVEMHAVPQWKQCAGVQKVLELAEMTKEEEFFFFGYLESQWTDEYQWRDYMIKQWNAYWHKVPNGWGPQSRRAKFDHLIWKTMRFPALVPQVWLNWLHAAPEDMLKTLESQSSRVDFAAFADGTRYVIEIDGPSHYAVWKGHGYEPDEKEYARNLKIERWLRSENWEIVRIGRHEVREAMEEEIFAPYDLVRILPFGSFEYPEQISAGFFGLPEIDRVPPKPQPVPVAADDCPHDDDIPF